ncbi:hypothetical protein TWF594_004368 [Orbilia oligospora]|nr:hypothetical protein TWF594_004368 [Orbilia oligospora]
MPTFIPQNNHLEEQAAAISALATNIQAGELYRNRLLAAAAFLHQHVDGPVEYPVKAEAKDKKHVALSLKQVQSWF